MMEGWTAALLSVLFVMNPIGVARAAAWGDRSSPSWRREVAPTVGGAVAALAGLGLLTAPLLDIADLTTPTFRLAASLVIGVTGTVWMVGPTRPIEELEPHGSPQRVLGLTMLLTPGPVFAAMAANGDGGTAAGLASVVVAGGATLAALVAPRLPDPVALWATRLIGAVTIAIAVGIGINSARTV
jgi:hypothetical protein